MESVDVYEYKDALLGAAHKLGLNMLLLIRGSEWVS